ncbi:MULTISPECIES: hypothetical protein [Mumia]|uniref:hypothetical protein n=1 Tax=Mumia TaxID=1546255 RepID=UPI00141F9ABF|nr:hypothetical protein [Mumia sp. ZJ430]
MSSLAADTKRAVRGWIPADLSRAQKVTAVALVLIAVQVAFRAWAVFGGWFYTDDFVFLSDFARDGISWSSVLGPHDAQVMPLGLGLAALASLPGGFAWPIAALEIMVLQALASLACWFALRTLFGDRPAIVWLLAWYLTSALTVPSDMWWAVALNQLPLQIVLFGAIATHVLYLRTRLLRYASATTLLLVVGYLAYVKTLVVPVLLVLLTLAYFAKGRLRGRALGSLRTFWPAWLMYGVVTAAYAGIYLAVAPSINSLGDDTDYAGLAETVLTRTLLPGLVGGPWRWEMFNDPVQVVFPPALAATASAVLVGLVLAFALLTRRRAARALVLVATSLVFSYALLATSRAEFLGALVGREPRYIADVFALTVLAVGAMFLPIVGATEPSEPRDPPLLSWAPPRPLLVALGLVVGLGGVWSTLTYVAPWHDDFPTRAFVGTAVDELEGNPGRPLADEPVPDPVMWANTHPYHKPSYLLAPVGDLFATPRAATDLSVLNDDGMIRAAHVPEGIHAELVGTPGCGVLVDRPRTFAFGQTVHDYPGQWLAMSYLGSGNGRVTVRTGERTDVVDVRRGPHTLFVDVEGDIETIEVRPVGDVTLCVDRIVVGDLEPSL